MEQQGAAARYANCGDEENSQAEGTTSEGAVGYQPTDANANANTNNNASNPHYENIYESIDAAAAAPAENININLPQNVRPQNNINAGRHQAYRNELYDRTAGYDVPRQVMRQNFATNGSSAKRHLHLDLNPNRPRYTTASRPHRQRSFDDTESYHYNNFRYENIYEQIHEEPIYRNASSAGPNSTRLYSRLGVIGHGVGRIERHLSSSCGNIDHYNLGGHYAVLGHSHLGTVGHIRLNSTGAAPNNSKDASNTKSLNFFSCLSRENSQSMTNIHREASASTAANNNFATSANSSSSASATAATTASSRPTGTIPKTKIKNNQKSDAQEESAKGHESTLNRISKSSLQWLLVNKWLPLWMGQGPDYNILDFNFMFSRNCGGCSNNTVNQEQGVVRFNGHAEMRPRTDPSIARRAFSNGVSGRPMRINHSLNRLREYDHPAIRRDGSLDDRRRDGIYDRPRHRDEYLERSMRARSEGSHDGSTYSDPFRNWELNTENNSFRPAASAARGIRRITDGTFPSNGSSSSPAVSRQNSSNQEPLPQQQQQQPATSKTMERVYSPRLLLDSRTESGNESPSPDMGRRYSDNTEDDQNDDDRGENNSNDDNENSV
ncbi:hypothetical protein HA402_014138 [Bradysia odoriphaga]|nr:hypothetical protein HA402_014138 [Bradysia odoriphaga]